ncbi:ADK-domain-containing protein [Acaromyces ingoldii]|uniref:ADK-domain-containing protein n=1 Tax=Acaromyces ingoldii TaxID=215250 RepID=A0A316YG19_9BASI|nr:ADK-domain-containing protein [Acaromyces ingoldii]PWN88149.1 ADK-domain-containing protein [Acaromyces ingoldii]
MTRPAAASSGVLGSLCRHATARCSRSLSTTSPSKSQSQSQSQPPPPPLRGLIIGSPGSGKGTLSSRLLAAAPSIHYLSGGDLLRAHISQRTELGKQAEQVIRDGGLMPDETMMNMIRTELERQQSDEAAASSSTSAKMSTLLDGFPRTRRQAEMLDESLLRTGSDAGPPVNLVLHLDVPDDVVMSRILDRWIHEPSGRTYNDRFNPPKVKGHDDVTGEALVKRVDDSPETIKARLQSFRKSTQPMIDYYRRQSDEAQARAGAEAKPRPLYVCFTGTSSDEIWPRLREQVAMRFPGLFVEK